MQHIASRTVYCVLNVITLHIYTVPIRIPIFIAVFINFWLVYRRIFVSYGRLLSRHFVVVTFARLVNLYTCINFWSINQQNVIADINHTSIYFLSANCSVFYLRLRSAPV